MSVVYVSDKVVVAYEISELLNRGDKMSENRFQPRIDSHRAR